MPCHPSLSHPHPPTLLFSFFFPVPLPNSSSRLFLTSISLTLCLLPIPVPPSAPSSLPFPHRHFFNPYPCLSSPFLPTYSCCNHFLSRLLLPSLAFPFPLTCFNPYRLVIFPSTSSSAPCPVPHPDTLATYHPPPFPSLFPSLITRPPVVMPWFFYVAVYLLPYATSSSSSRKNA